LLSNHLPFNQSNVSRARPLLGLLDRELDSLALSKQFEHRAANRAAMKEMLESGLIPYESEALVDKEACDCTGRHTLSSDVSETLRAAADYTVATIEPRKTEASVGGGGW
jgi:tryptophan 2,3-dioxygenase